ncbi:MAG: universal stress protein [Phycisphaeraceae bacterium]|nr:universal stress protein [Phycisphaeraceae bacterium]
MSEQSAVFVRILACIAHSPGAERLARQAIGLAQACGAELTFLHVGSDRKPLESLIASVIAESSLEKTPELLDRVGRADRIILHEARRIGADLILAGALGVDPMLRELWGSTSRRLARRFTKSVWLTVHRGLPQEMARRIVAVAQLDAASSAMVRDVAELARRLRCEQMHIVYEYDPYLIGVTEATGTQGTDSEEYERMADAAARLGLSNFLEGFDFSGVQVKAEPLAGKNLVEASQYARFVKADLVVIAAPIRRMGFLDRFFRHPAETVMLDMPCSVLFHRVRSAERRG